jgi:hypothetical protein
MSFAQDLLDKLSSYKLPMTITLGQGGAIEANNISFDGPWYFSVVFCHPEGDIVMGANLPIRAESFGISEKELKAAAYAELVKVVRDQTGADCQDIDECPWVDPEADGMSECFDDDGAFLEETLELREALISWLSETDEDAADNDAWCSELSEGLVGYAIREALPPDEVDRLGLKERDLGGPASSSARIVYEGDPSVLQEALRTFRLPFQLELNRQDAYQKHGSL